ncbi:MAG: class I SAM-dependent DNA methyltransferase [Paludibacter sp.]|nr:class I SAM-dependent DNA methyltransferase [Paludibacter sp.]
MASIKYSDIEKELKKLSSETLPLEIGYKLLKAFGTSDTYIKRYKAGKGNLATFDGVLVKKQFAYKPVTTIQLTEELEALKKDDKIAKQNPRIIAVSDGETLLAYDTKERESYENKVDKIWLDFQFFYPLAGEANDRFFIAEEADADVKAAVKMAKLHNEIRRQNEISSESDVHDLNIFMTRLLFCFFAEDTKIFEKDIFSNYIKQCTQDDGSDLAEALDTIFNVMDNNARLDLPNVIKQFPYVNGGLFSQRITIPQLGYKARKIILECGTLNWGEINPDIFGSMFQGVVTPELRGNFGMHYTSVPNILKLIQPLFLNELNEAYLKAENSEKQLNTLLIRISKMKFFDPACGSGNFLIITYKKLRELEIRIWKRIAELTGSHAFPFTNISIKQFYGVEIDSFAHEIAMLSLWLAEHQMNALFTKAFSDVKIEALPLKNIDNIREDNACRIDWNEVCPHTPEEEVFVMGNPPYLGSAKLDEFQQRDRTIAIGKYANYKKIDYIGIWFIKGSEYLKSSNAKCAFVSTNSVCQGEMVDPLWTPILNSDILIDFAHLSFKWSNNATQNAAVFCVIIGLINKEKHKKSTIFEGVSKMEVSNINPYLIVGDNLIVKKHTNSLSKFPLIIRGCMPYDGGNLLLSETDRVDLTTQFPDSIKYIKKLFSSADFINGLVRYCLWISDEERENAEQIPFIKQRIEKTAQIRIQSSDEGARKLAQRPHQFREFNACNSKTLIIPSTSSSNRIYIPMDYSDSNSVVTNACYTISDAPLWLFGVMTSAMNIVWLKTIGGKLKMDYRYTSLCYNSFPFPEISLNKKKIIEALAEEVLLTRENYTEKTLAEMYDPNKMPTDLRAAHHALDLAVDGCYQSAPFNNDEERLACLFKLYEKMTK